MYYCLCDGICKIDGREKKKDMDPRTECGINNEDFNHWIIKKNGLDAERGSRERERIHGKKRLRNEE